MLFSIIKDVVYLVISAIFFPTFDTYSDIGLIWPAYANQEYKWPTAMMIPICANWLCTG